jgi:hypothetical protein
MLRRAFIEGFRASKSIERDKAWSSVRKDAAFERVLGEAKAYEKNARYAFERAGGRQILRL